MANNTAGNREESGRNTEPTDLNNLLRSAEIAKEAAEGLEFSMGKDDWITLMQALSQLVIDQARAGNPEPAFSSNRLREHCASIDPAGQVYWSSEEDTGRKKFSEAWKKLSKSFASIEPNLKQRAAKAGLPFRVALFESQAPLDKRAKQYSLRLVAVDLEHQSEQVSPEPVETDTQPVKPATELEYLEEMEVYPLPGVRRPIRINIRGWRSLLITLPLVCVLFILTAGSWLLLKLWVSDMPVRVIFQWTVIVSLIGGFVAWIVWPLYRLLEDRIVMAPAILQLTSPMCHVLVIRREGDDRVIRMVRYTGKCPACGGLVEIQRGKYQFQDRYVGTCDRNPLEHIYSFDHTLKCGRNLRIESR